VLENIPQLIVQVVYAVAIGGVTDNVLFAFIASMLSVVATLLSFTIDRRGAGDEATVPMQYYLSLQCTRAAASAVALDGRLSPKSYDLDVLETAGVDIDAPNELTRAEKASILKHSGRRLALSRSLSALWDTLPKCVEIGSTVLGKSGARIHVVHFVDASDAQSIEQCYASREMQRRVSRIMSAHFKLSSEHFTVEHSKFENENGIRVRSPTSPFSLHSASSAPTEQSFRDRLKSVIDEYASNELNRALSMATDDWSIELRTHQSKPSRVNADGGAGAGTAFESSPELELVELGTPVAVEQEPDTDDRDVAAEAGGAAEGAQGSNNDSVLCALAQLSDIK